MMTMTSISLLALLLVVFVAKTLAAPLPSSCPNKGLAVYQVTFYAEWSKSKFPKQYPLYRPPAQWSKMLGRSHNANYKLFSVNDFATPGVKTFAEKGDSSILDDESQGFRGILDVFAAPPIAHGIGNSGAKFFADPQHSRVSMMAKIVPSPDWFVGIDGVDLCRNGDWADRLAINLDPLDSGTDQGYTFTAPNWPSQPQVAIYKITSKYPSHAANSFYYPELARLPRIGRLVFKKVAEYGPKVSMADVREESGVEDDAARVQDTTANQSEAESGAEAQSGAEVPPPVIDDVASPAQPKPKPAGRPNKHHRNQKHHKQPQRQRQRSTEAPEVETPPAVVDPSANVDCIVNEWAAWSPCSKSCGYGRTSRRRLVETMKQNDGRPCPLLEETKLCGSMRSCGWKHFSFSNWN